MENNIDEIWKDIPDYEGIYKVSEYGKILSLERLVYAGSGNYRTEKAKILKQLKSGGKGTHLAVQLAINGTKKTFGVHVVVALAFIPNPDNLKIVEHIDDNPHNNHYTNLKWSNNSDNIKGAYDRGRKFSRHHKMKDNE